MKAPPRLYIDTPMQEGQILPLTREASHYVAVVMRRRVGDQLRLFNGRNGEWQAQIVLAERKSVQVNIGPQTRVFTPVPDVHLLFAPVKKSRAEFIVEKATELGVRRLQMVQTRRTTAHALRAERMTLITREAAEQTERLDLPEIVPLEPLEAVLQSWGSALPLFFCDEAGEDEQMPWGGAKGRALPLLEVLQKQKGHKAAILIGPEGGFAPEERNTLRGLDFVHPVTLGPRILRADTAAIAALGLWQSVCGDWKLT